MESPFFFCSPSLNISAVTWGKWELFYNSATNCIAHGFIQTFDTGMKTSIRLALKKHGAAENTDYIWVKILYGDKPAKEG